MSEATEKPGIVAATFADIAKALEQLKDCLDALMGQIIVDFGFIPYGMDTSELTNLYIKVVGLRMSPYADEDPSCKRIEFYYDRDNDEPFMTHDGDILELLYDPTGMKKVEREREAQQAARN